MRLGCVAMTVVAGALLLPSGAQASAEAALPEMIFMPWQLQAALQNPDPEKPMCVGIQTAPLWGEENNYTGACRYGAPVGQMNAAVNWMDRKKAVGNARELGLAERFGVRLQSELNTIAGLPFMTGVARLKRHARSETRAAKDQGDSDKPSWLKRAAVNCAIWGAVAATGENLAEIFIKHRRPTKDTAKAMAIGCSVAVVSPPLNKWIKSKGYGMDK